MKTPSAAIYPTSRIGFVFVLVLVFGVGAPGEASAANPRRSLARGSTIVDVRTPREFAAGHLRGAINIPVYELPGRVEELGTRDKPLAVYCEGGERSAWAAELLRGAGFTSVRDLGAMKRWSRAAKRQNTLRRQS